MSYVNNATYAFDVGRRPERTPTCQATVLRQPVAVRVRIRDGETTFVNLICRDVAHFAVRHSDK